MYLLSRSAGLICAALALTALAPGANAQLVATYQFNNSLAPDQAGLPALTAINGGSYTTTSVLGQPRVVYQRTGTASPNSSQSALQLDTSTLGLTSNNYSVELVMTFTDGSGFRRVVNSGTPGAFIDNGFYTGATGNDLDLYQSGSHEGGPSLVNGVYYDVLLSVNPSGEQAYLNGTLVTSITGNVDAIASHFLTFFQDDATEYGNGNIALLRVYNTGLDAPAAAAAYNNGNPFAGTQGTAPEPTAAALVIPGVLAAAGMIRRRRSPLAG